MLKVYNNTTPHDKLFVYQQSLKIELMKKISKQTRIKSKLLALASSLIQYW